MMTKPRAIIPSKALRAMTTALLLLAMAAGDAWSAEGSASNLPGDQPGATHGAKANSPSAPMEGEKKKAEWIEQTLDYGIQDERIVAIDRIPLIKDAALRSKLVKKLIGILEKEDDAGVLLKGITALSEMKEKGGAPLMVAKLDHLSEDVRTGSVYGLKNLKALSAKERLADMLGKQDMTRISNLTDALIDTLGELGAKEAAPFAMEKIRDKTTHLTNRQNLTLFLGKVGASNAKELLLEIYRDDEENATLRSYAVNSLSKMGIRETGPEINRVIELIDSYDAKKRAGYNNLYLYSVAALARLGDPEAVPKLINALRSNNAQTRLMAIGLIKDFREKRTIDILKYKMKYDQNARVRAEATKALEEMGVDVKEDAR